MGEEGNQSRGEAWWDWRAGGTWPKGQKGGLKQEGWKVGQGRGLVGTVLV